MKKNQVTLLILLITFISSVSYAQKEFLVIGDSKILLVDYNKSSSTNSVINWEWDASTESQLPEDFRRKFKSMDDAKFSKDGKKLIFSSSSGGVGVMTFPSKKLLFYTEVGNAHSIEFLPDGLIAVAGSIHPKGNSVEIYNPSLDSKIPLAKDSLYSGHGIVWHSKRKLLYALGYDVLRAYTISYEKTSNKVQLTKVNEWKIPGKSGHDLYLTPDQKSLFITEHTSAWEFSLDNEKFTTIKDFPTKENIKSIGLSKKGTLLYTEPEESWWTYNVKTINPEKSFPFPGMKVYKARWKF